MFSKHGGGLYGDLPKAKGDPTDDSSEDQNKNGDKARWGASVIGKGVDPALAPVVVKRRPPPVAKSSVPVKSKSATRVSVTESGSTPVAGKSKTNAVLSSDPIESASGLVSSAAVRDPYDPFVPNAYEKIQEEKDRARALVDQEIERLEMERVAKKKQKTQPVPATEPMPEKGMSLAQKMLEKMGWKKGQGLGKNKQGISEALKVEKTDVKSGRIVEQPVRKQPSVADTKGPPSNVIILTNVVGPGEVDETLDDEIGTECSKHGEVASVTIFEVTDPSYPPERAVRVFVEFEHQEAATKAIEELDGRFFGGRVVQADYYDKKRFNDNDLAPSIQ